MREKDNNENIVLITYEVTGVNDLFVRLGNVNGKKTIKTGPSDNSDRNTLQGITKLE